MPRLRKPQLLKKLLEGCRDAGWGVVILDAEHPFKLRLFDAQNAWTIRIYIWNLTHGGGRARPVNEYRIQVTGIDPSEGFLLDGAEKTLILGWWAEAEVFAAFDVTRHPPPLGLSPSIQIREEALRLAAIHGFATHDKGSGEIAVAVKPELLPEYVRQLEQLHEFGDSMVDQEALNRVAERSGVVDEQDMEEVTPERRTVLVTIARVLRDESFRNRVLSAYDYRCAFCGIQLKLVEAAHIVPVASMGSDETSNGLALCALHHRAFDRALVTLNEDYQTLVHEERIGELHSLGLDGGEETFRDQIRAVVQLPPTASDRPARDRINKANQLRGWT